MVVSEATRRSIIRTIKEENICWSGRLDDVDFLSRIYDLDQISSNDYRFENAKGDIYQHRINNDDWLDDWIFNDPRFNLLHCPDIEFLRFLCEMINPIVRSNTEEVTKLLEFFNEKLASEGYAIAPTTTRFGNVRFEARGILAETISALDEMEDISREINSDYLRRGILRMTTALKKRDFELAIGSAKEFVETICKIILNEKNVPITDKENLPKLIHLTIKHVSPFDEGPLDEKSKEIIKKILGSLSTLTQSLAELRNLGGTGHGKIDCITLELMHATLAVNAASTIALFLYHSHEQNC